MNIYQHVENSFRELDSKLLLAVIAASRGHNVVVSELNPIIKAVKDGSLPAGLFHTKSLTPREKKIERHLALANRGCLITSIDEEGGLVDHGYNRFAKARYSEESVDQASAVFGWGVEDTETLKRIYSNYSSKIHLTGSPRADLWRRRFSQYWGTPKAIPAKPYLLVSSSLGAAIGMRSFHEVIHAERASGFYQRDPERFKRRFGWISEGYRMTLAFIEAISYLAESTDEYTIVLRPHPSENIEAWEVFLKGIPNVHLIREGSITPWVNNAFAVMHNGSTSALEATVSGKPVLTYLPFMQEHARELPNELGIRVNTPQELSDTVHQLLHSSPIDESITKERTLPDSVAKKIYLDADELAAEKIVQVWESLDNGELSEQPNVSRVRTHLRVANLQRVARTALRQTAQGKFPEVRKNGKFPAMDADDIHNRVSCLQHLLGLNCKLQCKLLSKRSALILPL